MTQQWTKARLEDWARDWTRTPMTVLKAFIDAGFCSDEPPSREIMPLLRPPAPNSVDATKPVISRPVAPRSYDTKAALEQITKCGFECEAGHLDANVGWAWLKHHLAGGPLYLMGQTVWYELKAEVAGQALTKWTGFTVVGCQMSSNAERVTWLYDLSRDPPSAYHYGTVQVKGVGESSLRLENPEGGAA